jgi:hypothetical protein
MKRSYFTRLFPVMLVFILIEVSGCSSFKYMYTYSSYSAKSAARKMLPGEKSILKKKILLAPVINMAGFSEEKTRQLNDELAAMLKEDASLSVTLLTGFESSRSAVTSSELGVVTASDLIKKADSLGMNTLITYVVEPLNYTVKKRGIWPFRKLKGEYDVSAVISAIDVNNGTLITSIRETQKIKMGQVQEGQEAPKKPDDGTLNEVLKDIRDRQAITLFDVLDSQEWQGAIILEGEKIKIKAGSDIGIRKGSIFDVYEKGERIKAINGKDYYITGQKAGEISVTDVMADYSYATPLGNKVFETGQIIMLKTE